MDPFDGRVVSTFIRQALSNEAFSIQGSGQQTRSFCYVDDLINGIYKFAQADHLGPINLGNPNEMSVLDLAAVISSTLKVETKLVYLPALMDDPQNRNPDITLANSLLDWAPAVTLEDGIKRTATWIKLNL
jgi:nucleoside-diphosphate-sugar epimerase